MGLGRRTEPILGLVVPLSIVTVLVTLGIATDQPGACIAFMSVAPMLTAVLARVVDTVVVAVAACAAAVGTAIAAYGETLSNGVPILVGVILCAAAAVVASQARSRSRPRGRFAATHDGQPMVDERETRGIASMAADPLTGLPRLPAVAAALAGSGTVGPRTVVLIGCDGMSDVNGMHGRAIGDEFLFAVAGRTRNAVADDDIVARWAGDELLLVIGKDLVSAGPVVALVADRVNANPIRTAVGLLPATISAGAVAWPEGVDFEVVVVQARRALHLAKSRGPGQLAVVGSSP